VSSGDKLTKDVIKMRKCREDFAQVEYRKLVEKKGKDRAVKIVHNRVQFLDRKIK
jgi:hypothetical protein